MNLLDISIIIVMGFFIVRGIFRGFFMEIASLSGVILGIFAGLRLHGRMTVFLKSYLRSWDSFGLQLLSFALIFFLVLVLCNLIGWGLKNILRKTPIGWTDKALGAALAVLKGIIVTYVAIILLTFFVPSKTPLIAGSRLAPWVISSYQTIAGMISPGFYEKWKRKFMDNKKQGNNARAVQRDWFTARVVTDGEAVLFPGENGS